jgi:hypothetical protein
VFHCSVLTLIVAIASLAAGAPSPTPLTQKVASIKVCRMALIFPTGKRISGGPPWVASRPMLQGFQPNLHRETRDGVDIQGPAIAGVFDTHLQLTPFAPTDGTAIAVALENSSEN